MRRQYTFVCPQCNREFHDIKPNRKFCSYSCSKTWWLRNTPADRLKSVMIGRPKNTLDDFFSHIDTSGGPDACHPWSGYNIDGYGKFVWKGKMTVATRIIWEINNGPVPEGKFMLHSCDNPSCCNVRHLRPGTTKENSEDATARGRRTILRGEDSPVSKLKQKEVDSIRIQYALGGESYRSLGEKYGVSSATIGLIVKNVNWKV